VTDMTRNSESVYGVPDSHRPARRMHESDPVCQPPFSHAHPVPLSGPGKVTDPAIGNPSPPDSHHTWPSSWSIMSTEVRRGIGWMPPAPSDTKKSLKQ
jgi:hypothetical protein